MQTTSFLTAGYLDILFLNRNKSYGAYELRSNYHIRAAKAIGAIVLSVLIIFLFSFRKTNEHVSTISPKPNMGTPIEITKFHFPEPKPIAPPKATKNDVKKYTTYVIKKDDDVHEKLNDVKDLDKAQIGTKNIDGESTRSDEGTSATQKGEAEDTHETVDISTPSMPLTYTSVMPDFAGNLNEYLSKKLKYPELAKENNVQGRVTVQFVVNEDGSISEAKVLKGIGGGCDEEALRVINNMPRWKPGMHNGKAVRVYMNIPIVFQLH